MLTIHLIKHTLFINFGENRKDTNGTIIFDIKFDLLFLFLFLMTAFSNINCFQFFNFETKLPLCIALLSNLGARICLWHTNRAVSH